MRSELSSNVLNCGMDLEGGNGAGLGDSGTVRKFPRAKKTQAEQKAVRDFEAAPKKWGNMAKSSSSLAVALLSMISLSAVYSLDFVNEAEYGQEKVLEENAISLRYGNDAKTRTLYLAVTLELDVSSAAQDLWIGVGIGERNSGSMLGSDIAVVAVRGDEKNRSCTITDRYVPFVAYPLIEAPTPFPVLDDCPESDWKLINCHEDSTLGVLLVEIERPFDAASPQDRPVVSGVNKFIYAYGTSFGYHGASRGSAEVDLLENSSVVFPPQDFVRFQDFAFSSYAVPTAETTYACQSFEIDLGGEPVMHITGFEAFVDEGSEMFLHHLVVYQCVNGEFFDSHISPTSCGDRGQPTAEGCRSVVYAGGGGKASRMSLPANVGLPATEENHFLLIEIHYDNSRGIADVVDSSGVRVYLSSPREHEAGIVVLGDGILSRYGKVMENGVEYQHECPGECTSLFTDDIFLLGSLLHMHSYGEKMWTHHYDGDRNFLENVNNVTHWNVGFQQLRLYDEPIKVMKGDILETTCVYNSTKHSNVRVGPASSEEMCMDFALYYPRQTMEISGVSMPLSFCGLAQHQLGSATVCGEQPLFVQNPVSDFSEGLKDNFGQSNTCPEVSNSASPDVTASPSPKPSDEPSTSDEPTPSPAESATVQESNGALAPEERPQCFGGDAEVELENGRTKKMYELAVGDRIRTGRYSFSSVYSFGHRKPDELGSFLNITTDNGSLLVTSGHFLYNLQGQLVPASSLSAGTTLPNGEVLHVRRVFSSGVYNPHTLDGKIAVNGFLASVYTNILPPIVSHALLLPARIIYMLFRWNILGSFFHQDRIQWLPETARQAITSG